MQSHKSYTPEELNYLRLLARQFPTVRAAGTEVINLQAIMNLPKGTEHFISDVHGEYEAFLHILNSCSGVVRQTLDELFGNRVSSADLNELATLIYYPKQKLELVLPKIEDSAEWYRITLHRLVEVCRKVSQPYTRSKVRKALPPDFAYIISELLQTSDNATDQHDYFENIIATVIETGLAPDLIAAVCAVIKRMAVDHMHIVGDIFDRGPRADIIMDSLLDYHSVGTTTAWTSSGATTTFCGWARPPAAARSWRRCWQTPSTTTTSRSWRPATASPCVRSPSLQTRSTRTRTCTVSA